ncbi:MAG TPA: DUF898 family protein, partial [Sulfurovum sp.]|nr:DUF898 family protein [Sulfurovum sp.]
MEALRFTGSGSEYFKIWIVNVLLTIITLGMYYPWAKVRNKRYFYANTNLADRNFEYHATGKQLFIGFLIAMIFFIIYSGIGQLNPALSGIFMLIFFLALPWLVWRSLMFNMRVTSFSNVHFSFKGSLKRAYMIFLGYPALFFLFFGLIGVLASLLIPNLQNIKSMMSEVDPAIIGIVGTVIGLIMFVGYMYFLAFIRKNVTEYTIGNSYYGQGKFEASISTKKLFILS